MATCNGATAAHSPRVQIESVQTVTPTKPTDRRSRRLSVPENLRPGLFRRWVHVILYYKSASDEDSGWVAGGWIKETLGVALLQQPMLGGRLRRAEGGELEIVSNDSGVRLLETRSCMDLEGFVELKKEGDDVEVELVFWEDINEQNPQFSPLTYVQVTNFNCGGYSIGFSCSLLVIDPLALISFLKQWANIHNTLLSKSHVPKLPTFYLPNFIKFGKSISNPKTLNSLQNMDKTLIFKDMPSENLHLDAASCIEELERELGCKTGSTFTLIVKENSQETKAERVSREGINGWNLKGLVCESWDSLGADEIILVDGNKPICVSCWINSVAEEGLVMVNPSLEEGNSGNTFIVTVSQH